MSLGGKKNRPLRIVEFCATDAILLESELLS